MHINDILDLPNLQDVVYRFEQKFVRRGPDDCWNWTAATIGGRYGKIGLEGQFWGAHCLSYLFARGPMPNNYGRGIGKVLCRHTCDNVRCVNPKHIALGFQTQNVQEAVERHMIPLGVDRAHTKLTDDEIHAIRVDSRPQRDIAADYGIAQGSVSRIKNRVRRQHV